MKKLALLALVLAFLSILSIPTHAERFGDKSFAEFCPIDSIAYFEMPDPAATIKRAKDLHFFKLFTSDMVKAEREFNELYVKIGAVLEAFKVVFEDRNSTCGPVSLAIPFMTDGEPCMMLAFNMKNPQEVISGHKDIVAKVQDKIKAAMPELVDTFSFAATEVAGKPSVMMKFETVDEDEDQPVFFVFHDFLVFCSKKADAERFVKDAEVLGKMRLDTNPGFNNFVNTVTGQDMRNFVNMTAIFASLGDMKDDIPRLIADLFDYVGQGLTFDGGNIASEMASYALRPASLPFLADMKAKSLKMQYLKYFPADSLAVGAVNLPSIQSVYPVLSQWREFRQFEMELANETGMSLSQEILASLGTEMGACFRMLGMPEFLFAVELADPDTIIQFLDIMSAIPEANLSKSSFKGNYLYTFRDMPPPVMCSAVVKDGVLLFGTILLLKSSLSLDEKNSMAANELFKQTMQKTNATAQNLMVYVDSPRAARTYSNTLSAMMGEDMSWFADVFDGADPLTLTAKIENDHLSYRSNGPIDISSVSVIAVPSLFQERRNSNESLAMATCRSFGSAAVDFSNGNPQNFFWENDTLDFAPYFSHVPIKGGYYYKYFSNDVVDDEKHEATRFVYLAFPVSPSQGRRATWIDESQALFMSEGILTKTQIKALLEATPNFEAEAGTDAVLPVEGVLWWR